MNGYFWTLQTIMTADNNRMAQRALRTSYASALVSASLVLFVTGVLAWLILNARQVSNYFKENILVSFVIKSHVSQEAIRSLAENLAREPEVKSVSIITREEAAEKLSRELGEDFISFLGTNPLPTTLDINIKAEYAEREHIQSLINRYSKHPAVMETRYDETLAEALVSNIKKIGLIILAFGSLLFFIMMVLIHNTIRLTLYARRFLIKSMQLVGATRSFIRWPFVKQGILTGIYSALIANGMLIILLYFTQAYLPDMFGLKDVRFMLTLVVLVLLAGVLISGLSTYLAVNRYLRKSFDELF
jgi:cell division transport system permease protein